MAIAVVGLVLTSVAFVANLVAVGDASVRATTLPWSFGLTTLGFGTIKLAIGVILWGILMKLWLRVDAIKEVLPKLVQVDKSASHPSSEISTPFGKATVTSSPPAELGIHRMAKAMWRPMLAMGFMAVAVGFVTSLAWAQTGGIVALSWTQGLQFLGEGMLLAGVGFLLGTILWAIRTGGGEVQQGLGVAVKTLKMPTTAKVFVALMMLGLMVSMAQFVGYLIVAAGGVDTAAWLAFLGPLRELALGLILAGITMALVTIGNVLRFQFDRIIEIIKTGK
ncbi:MAG: hypothetical protein WEA76_03860 [Acidimicrobiia bacterium]